MVAHICAPPRSTNMSTGNNANIWFQYRHKFDQLFTASEQIIPLNTSSDAHSKGMLPFKGHVFTVTAFSVAILMSLGVNLGN